MTTETPPLIQYRVFDTNEAFVEWQNEAKPLLYLITPVAVDRKVKVSVAEDKWKLGSPITYGVFVTYAMP